MGLFQTGPDVNADRTFGHQPGQAVYIGRSPALPGLRRQLRAED